MAQNIWRLGAAFICVALAACASPQAVRPTVGADLVAAEQQRQSLFVLEHRAAEYTRVYEIADRLTRANAELCARSSRTIGVRVENANDYNRDFRQAARDLWQLDGTPRVQWVSSSGPAAQAGLRVGDRILAVNERPVAANSQSSRRTYEAIHDAADRGDVRVQVRRGSETLRIAATPAMDCGYYFYMVDDDALSSAADGQTIYVFRGMLRFVQSDEELALVLSHELAHNAMRHLEASRRNEMVAMTGGLALDLLAALAGVNTNGAFMDAAGNAGAMMFSQEFEAEADYVGLYFMARAGYDIKGAEAFWRRMAAEHPRGIRLAYTHPNTAQRFVGIAAAGQEIALKQSQSQPLRPNMRNDRASPEATAPIATAPPTPPLEETQPQSEPVSLAPTTP